MSSGALSGIRVIDLTQVLSGPFCTQILADHGADVIKVEPPGGDQTRLLGPYHDGVTGNGAISGYFQSVNRNKRSIVLDLKTSVDCATLLALADTADVVVENFRPGVMDRLGLSYEAMAERNPRLVYAAIRGFGDPRTGSSPYSDWPAFDVVAQAMGGMMGITGEHGPLKIGPGVGDLIPATMCAFGIMAALWEARGSGKGQFLDVGMVDAILATCERIVHQYSYTGQVPGPEGNRHPILCPFGLFEAADGHVSLGAPHPEFWSRVCAIIGRPELANDPRYSTNGARLERKAEVYDLIEAFTRVRPKRELTALFGGRVPFGSVYDVEDVFADPHFRARDMLAQVEEPGSGSEVTIVGVPVKMARTPGSVRRRAPRLNEHADEIMSELQALTSATTRGTTS